MYWYLVYLYLYFLFYQKVCFFINEKKIRSSLFIGMLEVQIGTDKSVRSPIQIRKLKRSMNPNTTYIFKDPDVLETLRACPLFTTIQMSRPLITSSVFTKNITVTAYRYNYAWIAHNVSLHILYSFYAIKRGNNFSQVSLFFFWSFHELWGLWSSLI